MGIGDNTPSYISLIYLKRKEKYLLFELTISLETRLSKLTFLIEYFKTKLCVTFVIVENNYVLLCKTSPYILLVLHATLRFIRTYTQLIYEMLRLNRLGQYRVT